jgi:hypothetical protein
MKSVEINLGVIFDNSSSNDFGYSSMAVVFVPQFWGVRVTPSVRQWSEQIKGVVTYLVKFQDPTYDSF